MLTDREGSDAVGRGLSDLQRWILWRAAEQSVVNRQQVLLDYYSLPRGQAEQGYKYVPIWNWLVEKYGVGMAEELLQKDATLRAMHAREESVAIPVGRKPRPFARARPRGVTSLVAEQDLMEMIERAVTATPVLAKKMGPVNFGLTLASLYPTFSEQEEQLGSMRTIFGNRMQVLDAEKGGAAYRSASAAASRALGRLERRGYLIAREAGTYQITEAGYAALAEHMPKVTTTRGVRQLAAEAGDVDS